MTLMAVGYLLGKDHATILHGNKVGKSFLSQGDTQYTDAMVNWRIIFDEHELDITEETHAIARIKKRIQSLIEDSMSYSGISKEDTAKMLIELLKDNEVGAEYLMNIDIY